MACAGASHYRLVGSQTAARNREKPSEKSYTSKNPQKSRDDRSNRGGDDRSNARGGKIVPIDRSKARAEPAKLSNYTGKSEKGNTALSAPVELRPAIDPKQDTFELVADAIACAIDVYIYPIGAAWGVHVPNCNVVLAEFPDRPTATAWCLKVGLNVIGK